MGCTYVDVTFVRHVTMFSKITIFTRINGTSNSFKCVWIFFFHKIFKIYADLRFKTKHLDAYHWDDNIEHTGLWIMN